MFGLPFVLRIFSIMFWLVNEVRGFAFVVSPPVQCGPQRFTWVGGRPPFSALAIVPGGTLRNFSIPASAWNETDQSGDFETTDFPLAHGQTVVFSMGDADGPITGGNTAVMSVGEPPAGVQSCDTTDPGPAFWFMTDQPLMQCKTYQFKRFIQNGGVPPITVLVTIPAGESFYIHSLDTSDTVNWQANLTSGTEALFTMTDAQNRVGGTSKLVSVGQSDETSCTLNSPRTSAPLTRTPSPTISTATATATRSSGENKHKDGSSDNADSKKGKDSHTGLIVGVSVGGAAALLAIIALVYFIARRKGAFVGQTKPIDLTDPGPDSSSHLLQPDHSRYNIIYPADPTSFPSYHGSTLPSTVSLRGNSTSHPVTSSHHTSSSTPTDQATPSPPGILQTSTFDSPMGSSASSSLNADLKTRSATAAPATLPQRFIQHTDIEDELIELPPVYSESRVPVPIPGLSTSSVLQTGRDGMQPII